MRKMEEINNVGFWNDYQKQAWSFAKDSSKSLCYLLPGLIGEAGECCDKLKRLVRGDKQINSVEFVDDFAAELGDVMWYPFGVASLLDIQLVEVPGCIIPGGVMAHKPSDIFAAGVLLTKNACSFTDTFLLADNIKPLAEVNTYAFKQTNMFRVGNSAKSIFSVVAALAAVIGLNIEEIASLNIAKLSQRKINGTIAGSGDNR